MRRLGLLAKGIGALILLVLLLVGVPLLLVRTAGWPLPTAIPSTEAVGDALTRTGVRSTTVVEGRRGGRVGGLATAARERRDGGGGGMARPSVRSGPGHGPARTPARRHARLVRGRARRCARTRRIRRRDDSLPLPLAQALAAPAADVAPQAIPASGADPEECRPRPGPCSVADTLWGIAREGTRAG